MAITPALANVNRRFNIELLIIGFIAFYPLLVNPFFAPVFGLPRLTFLQLTALAIAGIWLVASVHKNSFEVEQSALRVPLISFFAIVFLSSLQSVHPLTSFFGQYGRWEGLWTIACYFILYLAAHSVANSHSLRKPFFLAILIPATLVSLIAIIEHFWTNPFLLFTSVYCAAGFGEPNSFEAGRSMATFGNATFLAGYLALALPVIFSRLMSNEEEIVPRKFVFLSLFVVSVALLLTFGRAAWIGAVAGVALVAWVNREDIKKLSLQIAVVLLVFALAFMIVEAVGQNYSATDRIASIFRIESSNLTRVQMWESSLPLLTEKPILGSGPDTFKYVFGKYKPEGWVEHISDPLVDKAHSDALQTAITLGAPGLILYLWILVSFFWLSVKKIRALRNMQAVWLASGLTGGVLAYAIQAQFNFSHFTTAPFFWLFLGLGSGLLLTEKQGKAVLISANSKQRRIAKVLVVVAVTILSLLSTLPLLADISFQKARDLQAANKLEEAVKSYERAVFINRFEPQYRLSLAEALFALGQKTGNQDLMNRGLFLFTQARNVNPLDEQIYFRAGATFLEAGRNGKPVLFSESIKWHYRGLTLNPVMVDAYIDIGVAYAYMNDYDSAINAWRDALEIEPKNDRAYFNLGWAYERKGDIASAKKAYLRAYELNPKMTDAREAYERL